MTLTDIVLDANVLFAAFMKEGTTRKILLTKTPTPLKLYAPPFLLDEVYKYKELLARKAKLPESEVFGLVLQLIYASGTEIIDYKYLKKFRNNAEKISPTMNDAIYFAVALYKKCPIWSNDKPIAKQNKIKIISTKDILAILNSLK